MIYNRKSVTVTDASDTRAISTADMKTFLRVSGDDYDDMINTYVAVATDAAKNVLRRALRTETMVFRTDRFGDDAHDRLDRLGPGTHQVSVPYILGGCDAVDLPFPPLQSVTSIVTYGRDNTAATFSASKYGVDLQSGRVYLHEGETWPVNLRDHNAVEITYVAGYGSGNIPEPILQAIRMHVMGMFDGCSTPSREVLDLLAPYRLRDSLAW